MFLTQKIWNFPVQKLALFAPKTFHIRRFVEPNPVFWMVLVLTNQNFLAKERVCQKNFQSGLFDTNIFLKEHCYLKYKQISLPILQPPTNIIKVKNCKKWIYFCYLCFLLTLCMSCSLDNGSDSSHNYPHGCHWGLMGKVWVEFGQKTTDSFVSWMGSYAPTWAVIFGGANAAGKCLFLKFPVEIGYFILF